jgi:hypothetical protein
MGGNVVWKKDGVLDRVVVQQAELGLILPPRIVHGQYAFKPSQHWEMA